jgi:hypothetical protein
VMIIFCCSELNCCGLFFNREGRQRTQKLHYISSVATKFTKRISRKFEAIDKPSNFTTRTLEENAEK